MNAYPCYFAQGKIAVDGKLTDPAWEAAPRLEFFLPVTNQRPVSSTEGMLLWDDEHLYAGLKAYDQDIWGYLRERDAITCSEDVLELFIKPDPESSPYYNFEVNPLGTVYDSFNVKRGAGGPDDHRWNVWDCKGMQVGVEIRGTLNNWEDIDEYWTLELAIPFSSLPSLAGKLPRPGDTWLFHLARYDYSVYLKEGVELSSTAKFSTSEGSFFHRYEEWQSLTFVAP
jgi:hypothetical protein